MTEEQVKRLKQDDEVFFRDSDGAELRGYFCEIDRGRAVVESWHLGFPIHLWLSFEELEGAEEGDRKA